jgi:hypothetical protein
MNEEKFVGFRHQKQSVDYLTNYPTSICNNRSVVFSGSSGSSTNKSDHHDITEILLKVALNTIKQTK